MNILGKLLSCFSLKLRFAIVMMAVTSVAIPVTLYAQDKESRMGKIKNNFDRLTNKISALNTSITKYAATAEDGVKVDEATEQAMDMDWVETMNIVTQIIAYSKPTGTLMFGIDEALMAANIDIKRMEKSGKDLGRVIESMKQDKTTLDKMKKEIEQFHNDTNEFKMRLRIHKYEYSYTRRAEQFHKIVATMREVVGGLKKTVSELKGLSNSKVLTSHTRGIDN